MASNSINIYASYGGGRKYYYNLSVSAVERTLTEENKASNKSIVDITGTLKSVNINFEGTTKNKLNIYWVDTNKNDKRVLIAQEEVTSIALYGTKSVAGFIEVEHTADGTLSGYAIAEFIKSGSNSYAPPSASIQTSEFDLSTIPRATACPNISGVIEGASINIALNPATSSFTHSIKVEFNELVGYLNASGSIQSTEVILSTTSPVINFGTEYYAQFDKASADGKLIVNTYNGATLIGSKEGVLNVSIDSNKCKPIATGTVKDVNSATVALTGDDDVIVKGYSTALITPTITSSASADKNTTISKKYINGIEFTTSTVTVNGALEKDFELAMTNSRDIPGTSTLSATSLLDYIKASITAKFSRSSSTSTDMRVSLSGNFFDDYFDVAKTKKNKLTISWSVKAKGTDNAYTKGGTIASTNYKIENNKITSNEIPLSNPLDSEGKWDSTLGYDFLIEYSDLLVSDSYKDSIKRGRPYYYWYTDANEENHLVALDHLDVKGDLNIADKDGNNKVNVKELIGLTGDTLPIGAMIPYGSAEIPTNWLRCDGSEVSRQKYSDLFNVIGTAYGAGDGSTTFNLPNKTGRISVGLDENDEDFDVIGKHIGEKSVVLTHDTIPSHAHNQNCISNYGYPNTSVGNDANVPDVTIKTYATGGYISGGTWNERSGYVNQTAITGGGQPHNNVQPSEVDVWIIKAFQSSGVIANVSQEINNSTQDVPSCSAVKDYIAKTGGGTGGTTDYQYLENQPKINGVTLVGNKTASQLKLPTKTSQLENDEGFLTEHQDISNLATKTYVEEQIAAAIGTALGGSY